MASRQGIIDVDPAEWKFAELSDFTAAMLSVWDMSLDTRAVERTKGLDDLKKKIISYIKQSPTHSRSLFCVVRRFEEEIGRVQTRMLVEKLIDEKRLEKYIVPYKSRPKPHVRLIDAS